MKLNLGCGFDYKKGYINCDVVKNLKVDKIVDLEKKLPFKNNSIKEILVYHVLEHINNFTQLMEEFYRICKNNAKIYVKVPYFTFPGAFGNPTHVRFFTTSSFNYFNGTGEFVVKSNAKFKIVYQKLVFSTRKSKLSKLISFFINKHLNKYERFFAGILPAEQLECELKVIK